MSWLLLQNSSCTLNRSVYLPQLSSFLLLIFFVREQRLGLQTGPILSPALWMAQFGVLTLRLFGHQPALPQSIGSTSESKWIYGNGNNGEIFWGLTTTPSFSILPSFRKYFTTNSHTCIFKSVILLWGKKSAKKQLRFINENVFHLYTCYTGHANTEIYRLYNDTIIKYSMTFVKHSVLQQNKLFLLVYYLGNRWRTNLEDTVPCYSLLHSQKKVFLWSTLT